MSRFLDVSGTVDKKQKESTPKWYAAGRHINWA